MPDGLISLNVNRMAFNATMSRYARELHLAPKEIVTGQMGLIMRELAKGAAPKNRAALNRNINRDISTVYRPLPRETLPNVHVTGKGFVWLMAGPNFLMGVDQKNYKPEATVADMQKEFYLSKGINPGNAYKDVGARELKHTIRAKTKGGDRQHIIDANRIMVKRTVYMRFRAWLKTRVGILGSSWAVALNDAKFGGSRGVPQFKMKHVLDGTHRGAFIDGLGIPGRATFTIMNHAAGVESANSLRMVNAVLRHRVESMKVDIKNILSGAYTRAGWGKKT